MYTRMFPEESDKIETYVGGLPDMIHESVMAYKPKTMQDAVEFTTELMDKKIRTFTERQTENKRKQDDNQHDVLIAQINAKSVENSDLNAQLEEKVFAITALKEELRKLKGKSVIACCESVNKPKVIAPVVHKIQEFLVYISDTCPSSPLKSEKLVVVTPMNKARKVTFAKTSTTSDNKTQIQVDVYQTQTTNKPLVPSTNEKCSTNASRSKPNASQWRPKETNHASSSSAPKIVESRTANHLEPNNHMGSNVSISPCFSSVQRRSYKSYLVPVAAAPRAVDLADSLVSTLIDQDAPSTSIPSIQEQEHSPNISQGFEESPKIKTFRNDPLHESLHEDLTSQGSSSNIRQTHTPFESRARWTKDHPIKNVIDNPSRCAVRLCAWYQAKPIKKHLNAVKRVFRYLKKSINMGLQYSKDTDMSLTTYSVADHARCHDSRRSTLGSAQFLGIRRALLMLEILSRRFFLNLNLSDHSEIVTHWFTLIVLSALRRFDNENMLSLVILILRFEHVGPKVMSSQDGEKRLCLVDDLKVLKITYSHTSQDKGISSSLKSMITTQRCKIKDQLLQNKDSRSSHEDSKINDLGTMADQRTMAQLLQAPTEGYKDAIVVPAITAENFELKHDLLTLVQNKQFFRHDKEDPHAHVCYFNKITSTLKFPNDPNTSIKLMLFPFSLEVFGHDKEDPHAHICYFNKISSTMRVPNVPSLSIKLMLFSFSLEEAARIWLEKEPPRSILTWNDLVIKFISQACPHHGFSELHQLDTFYNALNVNDQDSLNSDVGVVAKVSTSSSTPAISSNIAELKDMVRVLLLDKKNQSSAPASFPTPALVKATQSVSKTDFESYVKANDEVLRNMQNQGQNLQIQIANLTDMLSKFVSSNTSSSSRSGTLSSNTITNPKEDLKGITTRSGVAYQGPTIPTPSKVVKQGTEAVVAPVSALMPNLKPFIPYPSRRDNERRCDQANKQIEKFYEIFKDMSFEISFTDALTLMPKFASTLKALIGNKEKLSEMARTPMNEHCSAVILNKLPRKLGDLSKFLIPCEFPRMDECLALADLGASINLMPLSMWEGLSLPELTPTCMTLELADRLVSKPIDKKNQSSTAATSPTPAPVKAVESNCVTCGGIAHVQPPVTQSKTPVSEPIAAPVSALMPNLKPSIPYPS
nr:reverse transcriptase domain-containing protein [Tanacetum cinerariifolium]